MAETTVELILRAKNETQQIFDAVVKDVKRVTTSLKETLSASTSNKAPTFLTRIQEAAGKTTKYLKETNVEFGIMSKQDLNKVTKGIREMGKRAKEAEESVQSLKEEYEYLGDMGERVTTAFAIPAAVGTAASASYIQFARSISEVNTLLDGTLERHEILESQVLAVSSAYGQDKTEVATAYYNAVSSGAVDASNAVTLLEVAAKTAIGGVTDMGTAVDGITTILNAWQLSADDSTRAANALFVAMKGGKTNIAELSSYIAEAAPVASALGVSFEELLAATAAMTTGGTQTSQAFTRIRAAMDQIIAKKEINDIFKQMGYESSQAAVQANGLQWTLNKLVEVTGGSSEAMINLLGSSEAFQAVLSLTGAQAEKFTDIMGQMTEDTTALENAFKTMEQTIAQRSSEVLAKAANAFTVLGKAMTPIAHIVLNIIEVFADFVLYMNTEFPVVTTVLVSTSAAVVGLGLVVGTLILTFGKLGVAVVTTIAQIKALGIGVASLTAMMKGLFVMAARLVPQLMLLYAAGSFAKSLYEAYQYQTQLVELRASAKAAEAQLKAMQKAAPDAADLNMADLKEYGKQTEAQLKVWREWIRLKITMNNLEITSIVNRGDLTREDWDRVAALREQNKVMLTANNAIRNEQKARHNEFMEQNQTELAAERERIKVLIQENLNLYMEAKKANDPEMVKQLNAEYKSLTALLRQVVGAMDDTAKKTVDQKDALGLLTKEYLKTSEAIDDFRNNAQSSLDLDFSRAMDSLDVYGSKLENAYESGDIGAAQYIAEAKSIMQQRVNLERSNQAALRELYEQERQMRLQVINESEEDEVKKQAKRRELQRDTETFLIDSYQKEADAAKAARDQALNSYFQYSDEVKRIQKQLEQIESDQASAIRDIRRKHMTEIEQYNDRMAENTELRSKAEEALMQGNHELALQYANEMINLSQSLNVVVKDGERTLVSAAQAEQNAVEGVTAAYDLKAQALKQQKDEAVALARAQLEMFNLMNKSLMSLNNIMAELTGNTKLKIEVQEDSAKATKALEDYRRIAEQGATVPFGVDLPQSEKDKAIDGLGDATKQAEDQYGTMQVAVYSDTGEFEQEIYTITDSQGYGAQVHVTAEDGQFYATVAELEQYNPVVTAKPVMVEGDLQAFYANVEARIRANPPSAEVEVNSGQSQRNVNEAVGKLDAKDVDTNLSVNTTPAMEELSSFQTYANAMATISEHRVNVDNSAVEAAKASNSQNTSSTHTIYVREVQQRAGGGSIGALRFPRKMGHIRGAGTATSDSIPAMLSNGEFVHNTAAVREYGLGFMNMVNKRRIPKEAIAALMRGRIPHFNTGGAVGLTNLASNAGGARSTMDLNFMFSNGRSVTLQGNENAAKQLISLLREESSQ
ncbi:tail tape measure protein [Vibrio phage V-YDF132]|nr:tail tape measure protein [Vibrio phage V-YDF132]